MSARVIRTGRAQTPQTPTPTPRRHRAAPISPLSEEYHRDHSLISFEWQIQGLEWLRKGLTDVSASGWTVDDAEKVVVPELFRGGVVIGEGWYKLDLGEFVR